MIELIKAAAEAHYLLKKQEIGDYSELKGHGMRFRTTVYDAEDIGRLCLMEMKAFGGLMRMDTGVFSPVGRDGPIFSFDSIKAFGKETFLAELYDTTLSHPAFEELGEVKKKYAYITAYDPGEHWYDNMRLPVSDYKKGRKIAPDVSKMMKEYSEVYFRLLDECDPCDPAAKKECNAVFVNGLLNNGGPAVNTFKKMIGEEKTEIFLKNYMFCC